MRIPTHLTDPQLLVALERAACDERGATAILVAHLAEMDARTLHLGLGFSSLFEYCLVVLRLSGSIPAKVRRAVWRRDKGRCAFVAPSGRRCGERGRLELHHVEPCAVGGPPTVENTRTSNGLVRGYTPRP